MSKIIRTRKPSVLPFYAMALVFLVLCAVLPVYKLWALLAALGGAFVAFGAAQKVCPPRVVEHEVPFHTGVEDVDAMLTDIQQKLDTLHTLNEQLPDPQLSDRHDPHGKGGPLHCGNGGSHPAKKAKQVRRFANYYLPDAVNVLQQYAKLAKQGVRGENAAAIRTEVEHNAASIATAFENQLDALYAAESMDHFCRYHGAAEHAQRAGPELRKKVNGTLERKESLMADNTFNLTSMHPQYPP